MTIKNYLKLSQTKTKGKLLSLNDKMDEMEKDLNIEILEMVEDVQDNIRSDVN